VFVKLQKAIITSSCPSVHLHETTWPGWTDFHSI